MKRAAAILVGAALSLGALLPAQTAAVAAPASAAAAVPAAQRAWTDESIYFVFLDRFNNGDPTNDGAASVNDPRGWHGGDLQGVIDKLDYIKSMGFTAIWITPHVKNTGRDYHGYGAVDFFDTDPHFGTVEQTKELVDKAHAKGIRVIFDIVVNHTGPQNPLVAQKPEWFNPKSEISKWNDPKQLQNGWIFSLPDFDQSKPEVRQYILDYSKFWIEKTGVDGFRIDTMRHVPPEFITWYRQELEKVKPDFWMIGEVWESSPIKLNTYQEAGSHALLDFPASETARKVFAADASFTSLQAAVSNMGRTMKDPAQTGAFLDNHDMTRFVSEAKDDPVRRLKLGLTWLFSYRAIPIVYYGTEIAMPGKNDPYNRDDFPWGKEQNTDVRELITTLNRLRQELPALRQGTVEHLFADQTTYAFARVAGNDKVVTVLNNHATDAFTGGVDVAALGLPDGTQMRDQLTGKAATVSGGKLQVDVAARSGAIYAVLPAARGTMIIVGALLGLAALTGGFFVRRRMVKR
ncbi:MAG TPA: alpha-amylase family glycosyl hydrolase [Symbiobacteriaceae bacterium]|nr:alpha-amylase family glycosyl hydrolase [Symbiobacteriaceae bacterium]